MTDAYKRMMNENTLILLQKMSTLKNESATKKESELYLSLHALINGMSLVEPPRDFESQAGDIPVSGH